MPKEQERKELALNIINTVLKEGKYSIILLRDVPINYKGIGKAALESMPTIMQIIINKPEGINNSKDFERELYILRRNIEKSLMRKNN